MSKVEILNNILLGLVSSFLASWFTYLFLQIRQKKIDKLKYGKLEGVYLGNTLSDQSKPIFDSKPTSRLLLKYLRSNLLELTVTDEPYSGHNEWKGSLSMDSDNTGTIVWCYTKHENINLMDNGHLFGAKKFLCRNDGAKTFIYLIDESFFSIKDYPLKEVFRKI